MLSASDPTYMKPDPSQTIDADSAMAIPKVTWLMGAHRANELLRIALASCLSQTVHELELILVANGPQADDVSSAASMWFGADPRLRILRTPIRQLSFSLTLGLHHARAPLIARMDADDIAYSFRLERQLSFLERHPDVVAVGSACDLVDLNGAVVGRRDFPTTDASIRKRLRTRTPLCHPTVMFRREAVEAAGGYLGNLHAEDFDLWLRLANDPKARFANLPDACIAYRITGVGEARASRWAYAGLAASLLRECLARRETRLSVGVVLNIAKSLCRRSPKL